ncbi:MAG: Sir2 family NAD-dependent protein deacetylase, partial [bacterium]
MTGPTPKPRRRPPGSTLLARVRRRIARSESVMALTGAGLSAESGLTGFAADGSDIPPEYAALESFREDPVWIWQWYDARRQEVARAEPNPGHYALARLEAAGKNVFIVTRNLDDL